MPLKFTAQAYLYLTFTSVNNNVGLGFILNKLYYRNHSRSDKNSLNSKNVLNC